MVVQVDKEALDRLCILWSQFDKSGTGRVEVAELRRVMEDLGAVDAGRMEVTFPTNYSHHITRAHDMTHHMIS